jgi:membrane protein implicated in regulation of membrane protease activity
MTPLIWIALGLLLILSELLATSIIAVFLGLGALAAGIALQLGWADGLTAQLVIFSLVSLITLLLARRKLKLWFVGETRNAKNSNQHFQQEIGQRVEVTEDFVKGAGRVSLNGVHWDAYSEDKLKKGDIAWVTANRGIQLFVTQQAPNQATPQE